MNEVTWGEVIRLDAGLGEKVAEILASGSYWPCYAMLCYAMSS